MPITKEKRSVPRQHVNSHSSSDEYPSPRTGAESVAMATCAKVA